MAYHFFTLPLGGLGIDLLALLRIMLAFCAMYYYTAFCRREEAGLYQCRTRRLTFAFFVLESGAELFLTAFGNASLPLLLREIGRLGVAFTVFVISRKTRGAAYAILALPFVFTGVVRVAGIDMDVFSLTSMALVLMAINNYSISNRALEVSETHKSARNLFLVSLVAYYAFLFTGVVLGIDAYFFAELPATLAVALGVYSARTAAKSGGG